MQVADDAGAAEDVTAAKSMLAVEDTTAADTEAADMAAADMAAADSASVCEGAHMRGKATAARPRRRIEQLAVPKHREGGPKPGQFLYKPPIKGWVHTGGRGPDAEQRKYQHRQPALAARAMQQ